MVNDQGPASIRDGLTFAVAANDYRQGLTLPEDVVVFMRDALRNRESLDSLGHIASFVLNYAQTKPNAMIQLLALKAARAWYGTDSQRYEWITGLFQAGYLFLAGLGVLGAWRHGGPGRIFLVGSLLLILYFWGITIMVLPILRYMIPAMTQVVILIPASVTLVQRTNVRT